MTTASMCSSALILHDPLVSASDYRGGSHLKALWKKLYIPDTIVTAKEAQQSALVPAGKLNLLNMLFIGGGTALDTMVRGFSRASVGSAIGSLF